MYNKNEMKRSSLRINESVEGETIETKIERVLNNKEAITDGSPVIYNERKDGVLPGQDIRTDRFDLAIDAMDKVSRTHIAKRENAIKEREEALAALKNPKKDGGTESTQTTAGTAE